MTVPKASLDREAGLSCSRARIPLRTCVETTPGRSLIDLRPRLRRAVLSACLLLLGLGGCERYELDRQMNELCQRDGGVSVYEIVRLPAHMFDLTGRLVLEPSMALPDGSRFHSVLDDAYRVERKDEVIKPGDPFDHFLYSEGRLVRHIVLVRRMSNQEILGKSIWYARTGGHLLVWGRPSGVQCPTDRQDVVKLVFTRGD